MVEKKIEPLTLDRKEEVAWLKSVIGNLDRLIAAVPEGADAGRLIRIRADLMEMFVIGPIKN